MKKVPISLMTYIAKAISLLNEAGFDAFGVISPWQFGIRIEAEYEAAISRGVVEATGKRNAWFFLRGLRGRPNGTGLCVLEEVARRIEMHLSDRVVWVSFSEIMEMVLADKTAYPKPVF